LTKGEMAALIKKVFRNPEDASPSPKKNSINHLRNINNNSPNKK
jgi:hypothetical protein